MAANLNTVFVVDVESTCWKTREEQGSKPNEIIEIGIVAVDTKSGKVTEPASFLIKPQYSEVSAFCTELTGWTPADIEGGGEIRATLQAIAAEFGFTKNHIWFSCGEYDRIKLSSYTSGGVGDLYGIDYNGNPFEQFRSHVNIKTLFALKHGLSKELGMAKMLNLIKQPLDGRHHNGGDDAWNIAKLVKHVLL